MTPESLEHAADLIEQADALVICAGAGMGIDSGLPDFRGDQGFWQAYPALGSRGLGFSQVANPQAFRTQADVAWGFYGHRLALYRRTVPHAGFELLRRWAARMPRGAAVFTSNVDGQFQKAGFTREPVVECHGSIHHLQCLDACSDAIWPADEFLPQVDEAACRLVNEPPKCPRCGALARPNILMFGDWDWLESRTEAQQAGLDAWLVKAARPVVVELGAGTAIPSVRHFAQSVLAHRGGRLIRINPRESQVPSSLDVGLAAGALSALRAVDEVLMRRGGSAASGGAVAQRAPLPTPVADAPLLASLDELAARLQAFAQERQWQPFHTPKNLASALVVEAGELLEPFQWLTDAQSMNLDGAQRQAVADEMADVLMYLVRMASVMDIDLLQAATRKLALNAQRYPVDQVKGSARKAGP